MDYLTLTKGEIREAILIDLVSYVEFRADSPPRSSDYDGYQTHGVPNRSRRCFSGQLSPACRRAASRMLQTLADEGLIEKVNWGIGPYTTHLRPSEKLLRAAVELFGGSADMSKIAKSLASTTWGRDLADLARRIEDQA